MAFEDNDIQEQLQQAPPHAPTADDAEANKATADSAAAQSLARAASSPADLEKAEANDKMARPSGAWPYREKPEAPDIGQNAPLVAPGSFPQLLSAALVKAKSSLAPGALAAPGAWSKTMVGATMDALSSPWRAALSNADASTPTSAPVTAPRPAFGAPVLAQLGDAAAAPGPGGLVGGFARAAAAGTQRTREELNDRRQMAAANAQMLHSEALVHKMGEDAINESIAAQKQQLENITTAVPGAPPDAAGKIDAKGKTSDDLNQMLQSGELRPAEQTVFADGRIITGKDSNGLPLYRTTYTVVTPAKEVDLTPESAKFLNESLGLKGSEAYSTDKDKPQRLPGTQVNDLFTQANRANTIKRAAKVADAADAKNQKIIDEAQNSAAARSFDNSKTFLKVLDAHTVPGKDGSEDPYVIAKTYDYLSTHPDVQKKIAQETGAADLMDAYKQYAGGEPILKQKLEDYHKTQAKNQDTIQNVLQKAKTNPSEIEKDTFGVEAVAKSVVNAPKDAPNISDQDRKDAADILATVQEIKQSKIDFEKAKAEGKKESATGFQGDESATTPEAFLKSLKPSEQETVKMIGEGRAGKINLGYLASRKPEVLAAVAKAYPDFDQSKVDGYVGVVNDFASKKIADQLLSGGTVLQHLQEARELNTNLSHVGIGNTGTPEYIAYKNKVDTLADELGKFYGADTVPGIASFKDTILSTLPGNREAAILTQAKSMTDRLNGLVTRWRDNAPSKAYEAKMPWISPEGQWGLSKLSPQFAQDYPELVQQGAQTPLAKRERAAQSKLPANAPPGAIQRPADLPTATHTQAFTKGGVTKIFWTDAAGKPLREATEIPKE